MKFASDGVRTGIARFASVNSSLSARVHSRSPASWNFVVCSRTTRFPSRISEGRQTSLTATNFVWANQRSAHAKSVPPRPRSGDGGPEIDQSQNSARDSARLSQIPQQPLLPRSSLNADCALETRAMRDAITVSAAANRLECHMHFRAGPPPGQDDAVQ